MKPVRDIEGKAISVGCKVEILIREDDRTDLIGRVGIVTEITSQGNVWVKTEAKKGKNVYNAPGRFKQEHIKVIHSSLIHQ
jgi:hypothetical protein